MEIKELGFTINGMHHISGKDFLTIPVHKAVLLDVRPDYELSRQFDVDNIMYCPHSEAESRWDEFPDDIHLVVADAVGLRSRELAEKIIKAGFKNVCNLAGGIVEWERDGLPVTTDKTRILTGSCMCQLKVRKRQ